MGYAVADEQSFWIVVQTWSSLTGGPLLFQVRPTRAVAFPSGLVHQSTGPRRRHNLHVVVVIDDQLCVLFCVCEVFFHPTYE